MPPEWEGDEDLYERGNHEWARGWAAFIGERLCGMGKAGLAEIVRA